MKSKRIIDKALLEAVRKFPCLACTHKDPLGALAAIKGDWDCKSDAHHVRSRGSGGDDTWDNVMPLCREHHATWHSKGADYMARTFATIKHWLDGAKETP